MSIRTDTPAVCLNCKRGFYPIKASLKKGQGKYCSYKCAAASPLRHTMTGKSGEETNNWRGGRYKAKKDGYIYVRINGTYKMEHDVVMEKHIGRLLEKGEIVHHRNRVRDDNRIENLELMTQSEHAKQHIEYTMAHRWSFKHDCCKMCETTTVPYKQSGYCENCFPEYAMLRRCGVLGLR